MANSENAPGSISWTDLTVTDAKGVRDFYESVVGWTCSPVEMGDYQDYCMNVPESGKTVAGICHARGINAELPAQWLIYIVVADLQKSIEQCLSNHGNVLHQRDGTDGHDSIAVIQDPAGAVVALFQPSETS